jgi:lipopolysaccharide transport system ATP-binding protein
MNKPIIEVHDLSKKYRYGQNVQPYYTLRDTITGIFKSPKELLPKAVGGNLEKNEFWALKDVSFEAKEGEVLGIIGPNGSGKSTLLKILSQITPPTEGKAILRGRVGSLLEVGTGFHQELTGRENIYLNGAILGMSRREISKKFDEIVEFSGVEKFLDTPVKRYSSGMVVRLGFAVAAHLEPEILLIDEVLAVGDAEFQKKCLKKMDDIAKGGRTIIYVSHNLVSIKALCNKGIFLEFGKVIEFSSINKTIEKYRKNYFSIEGYQYKSVNIISREVKITKVELKGNGTDSIYSNKEFELRVYFSINKPIHAILTLAVFDTENNFYILSSERDNMKEEKRSLTSYKKGKYSARIILPINSLIPGDYQLVASIEHPFVKKYDSSPKIPIHVRFGNRPISSHWNDSVFVKTVPDIMYSIRNEK